MNSLHTYSLFYMAVNRYYFNPIPFMDAVGKIMGRVDSRLKLICLQCLHSAQGSMGAWELLFINWTLQPITRYLSKNLLLYTYLLPGHIKRCICQSTLQNKQDSGQCDYFPLLILSVANEFDSCLHLPGQVHYIDCFDRSIQCLSHTFHTVSPFAHWTNWFSNTFVVSVQAFFSMLIFSVSASCKQEYHVYEWWKYDCWWHLADKYLCMKFTLLTCSCKKCHVGCSQAPISHVDPGVGHPL